MSKKTETLRDMIHTSIELYDQSVQDPEADLATRISHMCKCTRAAVSVRAEQRKTHRELRRVGRLASQKQLDSLSFDVGEDEES